MYLANAISYSMGFGWQRCMASWCMLCTMSYRWNWWSICTFLWAVWAKLWWICRCSFQYSTYHMQRTWASGGTRSKTGCIPLTQAIQAWRWFQIQMLKFIVWNYGNQPGEPLAFREGFTSGGPPEPHSYRVARWLFLAMCPQRRCVKLFLWIFRSTTRSLRGGISGNAKIYLLPILLNRKLDSLQVWKKIKSLSSHTLRNARLLMSLVSLMTEPSYKFRNPLLYKNCMRFRYPRFLCRCTTLLETFSR